MVLHISHVVGNTEGNAAWHENVCIIDVNCVL